MLFSVKPWIAWRLNACGAATLREGASVFRLVLSCPDLADSTARLGYFTQKTAFGLLATSVCMGIAHFKATTHDLAHFGVHPAGETILG